MTAYYMGYMVYKQYNYKDYKDYKAKHILGSTWIVPVVIDCDCVQCWLQIHNSFIGSPHKPKDCQIPTSPTCSQA